jgi:hypothetical protein
MPGDEPGVSSNMWMKPCSLAQDVVRNMLEVRVSPYR